MSRYIDADWLLDKLWQLYFEFNKQRTTKHLGYFLKLLIETIRNNAFTADAQGVVHGHWVTIELKNGTTEMYCSNCHWGRLYYEDGNKCKSIHCPHCGAIMDEEVNNER